MVSAPGPRLIAHRGASGHAPENSLEAFRLARRMGADGIELDVHATRDGVLVVHHDPVLPGIGPIRDVAFQAARGFRLPNGEALPTLDEALAAAPDLTFWIEVKALDPRHDEALLAAIDAAPRGAGPGLHSFDHRLVARFHRHRPSLRLGLLSTAYLLETARALSQAGASALWQEWHLIDAELVAEVHSSGAEIIAWTVNDRATASRLAGLGVDALCGDYPTRLRAEG